MNLHSNPCGPDCPDRRPGCNCKKRKAWKAENEAKKKWLREIQSADSVLLPNRIKRFGSNKYNKY